MPERFGGKTLDEMRAAAEAMGRAFGLSFVFNEFELTVTDLGLEQGEPSALVYLVFARE